MNYIRFIIYDIKRCFVHNKYRIVLSCFMIMALMITFMWKIQVMQDSNTYVPNASFIDYVLYMVRGIAPITEKDLADVQIPYVWMTLQIICGFMIIDYIKSDLKGIGRNVLVYSKHKKKWWLSKCITTIVTIFFVYVIVWTFAFIFSLISKGDLFSLHIELFKIFYRKESVLIAPETKGLLAYGVKESLYIIFYPLLVSVCIAFVQITISQYTGLIISFIIIIGVDVMSVFNNNILLWGNWTMIERCSILAQDGHNIYVVFTMAIILGVVAVVIGFKKFMKLDIV